MRRRISDGRAQLTLLFERSGHDVIEVPVVVNSEGEFWAEWEGDSYKSLTLRGLREKLMPHVRTDLKRCSVPVLRLGYDGVFEEMTLIGLHAQNGNALVVNAKGQTEQHRSMGRSEFFPMLTAAERERFKSLRRAVKHAEVAVQLWKKRHAIRPKEVICKAIGLPLPKLSERALDDDDDDDV